MQNANGSTQAEVAGRRSHRTFALHRPMTLEGSPSHSSMRKVVVYELLSLDGVAEAPDEFFSWDDALDAELGSVIAHQDAVILGRRTYDEWASFWPASDIQPFATFINGVAKHVATSAPLQADWANSSAIEAGLVDFVRDLRGQPGGDIGVHGSISVAQSLLAAGLVDELKLVIGPMLAGSGRRLLDGVPLMQLEPIRTYVSPMGYVQLDYRVLRQATDPE